MSEDVQAAHHHRRVTSCERNIYCRCGKRCKAKRHTSIQTEAITTLPKREILCLTRAASLQNRLERKTVRTEFNKKLRREQRRAEKSKVSKEIRNMKEKFCTHFSEIKGRTLHMAKNL